MTYMVLEPELRRRLRWDNLKPRPEIKDEKFLGRVVEACAVNMVALDERGAVLHVSRAWKVLLGNEGLGAVGGSYGLDALKNWSEPIGIDHSKTGFRADVQAIIKGLKPEFENEYILRDVKPAKWFLVRAAKLDMPAMRGFRILVTLEDITLRKHAEEELRQLGGRLIKAQEEERSRVGRDLHDDLNQQLAIFSIELEQLKRSLPGDRVDLTASVVSLMTRAQELASHIHELSYQLHPFKLDTLGLCAAIKSLCDETSDHRNLKIKFHQKGFPSSLPPEIALCMFRIAQEAVHNIVKHSGAQEAKLVLTRTSEVLHMKVLDSGCGFDIETAKLKKRLGLLSIKERLRLVGGDFSIRSRPSEGTQIDVLIPIDMRNNPIAGTSI